MAVIIDGGGGVDTSTLLHKANNLSDLPDASTARTNLGLGTAATSDTSDFDAAGSAAAATAVSGHESTYDHSNIPDVDEAAALTAYQSALAAASEGEALLKTAGGVEFGAVSSGPRIYAASLSQSGTSAPVAVAMGNTIGTATWTRLNVGRYKLQFSGVTLDGTKTLVLWTSYVGGAPFFLTFDVGVSLGSILMSVWDSAGSYTDDLLIGQIKVEAYQTL